MAPNIEIKISKKPKRVTECPIDESAKAVLSYMFYERIRLLEEESNNTIVLSSQMKLKKLRDRIINFIQTNPYSFVEIVILEDKCDDLQNAKLTLTLKNFKHFIEDRTPNYYTLVINNAWNNIDGYEKSIDGEYLIPKKFHS